VKMARYILTKEAAASGAARGAMWTAEQIRRLPKVHVLDQTGDRIMLIEVDPKAAEIRQLRAHGWKVHPEVVYAAPWRSAWCF